MKKPKNGCTSMQSGTMCALEYKHKGLHENKKYKWGAKWSTMLGIFQSVVEDKDYTKTHAQLERTR